MFVRIEPNYVEPAKLVFCCRFWVDSSGQTNYAGPNMKEAQHIVYYEHRLVQAKIFHLSLLKFYCVEVFDNLRKLQ